MPLPVISLLAELEHYPHDSQAECYDYQPHENHRYPGLNLFKNTSHIITPLRMPAYTAIRHPLDSQCEIPEPISWPCSFVRNCLVKGNTGTPLEAGVNCRSD